jgi:hypothetical protein
MKLHNVCIDRNVPVPLSRFHEDMRDGDEWRVYDNTRADDDDYRERAVGDRRRSITSSLEIVGVTSFVSCFTRVFSRLPEPYSGSNNRFSLFFFIK